MAFGSVVSNDPTAVWSHGPSGRVERSSVAPSPRHARVAAIRADRKPWVERNLRVLITERPGFGASTRLHGRGFTEHADDLAALLDTAGIERAHVIGGKAPHLISWLSASAMPRVSTATVVVGMAPLIGAERRR